MKASKFSDAQKAFILKQGKDGVAVADICRKAGISQATYFNWKQKYDGLLPTEIRRLKQLEDENAKLKKLVADRSLEKDPVSPPTTPISKRPTVASGLNASTPIGSCHLRTPRKKWRIGEDTTMKNGPTGQSATDRREARLEVQGRGNLEGVSAIRRISALIYSLQSCPETRRAQEQHRQGIT
jgi:putative transposase